MPPLPAVPDRESHAVRAARWYALSRLLALAGVASVLTGVATIVLARNPVAPSPFALAAPWIALVLVAGLWFVARGRSRTAAGLDADERRARGESVLPLDAVEALANGRGVVALGAVVVLSLTAAGLSVTTPENAGDSPGRVMIVTDSSLDHAGWVRSWFRLQTEQLTPAQLSARARARLGRTSGSLADAMALADAEGVGFVVLDLKASSDLNLDTAALTLPVRPRMESDRFVALAVGDLADAAPETSPSIFGPGRYPWQAPAASTPSFGGPEPWIDRPTERARLSLMRALFSQPAFTDPGEADGHSHTSEPGKSAALLSGQIHYGLSEDFWAHALLNAERTEQILAKHRTPDLLADPEFGERSDD